MKTEMLYMTVLGDIHRYLIKHQIFKNHLINELKIVKNIVIHELKIPKLWYTFKNRLTDQLQT